MESGAYKQFENLLLNLDILPIYHTINTNVFHSWKKIWERKTKLGQNLRIYYTGAHQGPRKHADEDYRI